MPKFAAQLSLQRVDVINAFLFLALVLTGFMITTARVHAGTLSSASVQLSDSRPSTAAAHTFGFTIPSTTAIKTIVFQYCTTASGTCTTPSGMILTASPTVGTVSGIQSTTPTAAGTNTTCTGTGNTDCTITVTFGTATAQSSANQAASVPITAGITNPNSASVFYVRITTKDSSAVAIDSTTIAFATTTGISASVTVDPSITFTVNTVAASQTVNGATTTVGTTSTTIPFGPVSTSANGVAAHDLSVATNATNGYTVYIRYTGQLSDGNGHTFTNWTGTNALPTSFSAPGTSYFGYTTASTALSGAAGTGSGQASRFNDGTPLNRWAGFNTSNEEVAYGTVPTSGTTTRIGYQVSVGGAQAAGTYTTTVTLTATPLY